ncbi:MAG: DMT family transporter [Candidatus Saccharimonadales bacterium]
MNLYSWQSYVAFAVLSLSVAILLQRIILHKHKADPVAFATVFQLSVAFVMLPIFFVHPISFAGFSKVWLAILLATVAFGGGSVVYGRALARLNAAVFSVLFATQAIWIMLTGIIVFHEKLHPLQLLGTAVIFGSIFVLVKNPRQVWRSKGIALGLLTGAIFGMAIASASYVARYTDALTWVFASFILGGLASLLVNPHKIKLCLPLLGGETLRPILWLAVLYAVGNLAITYAYIEGPFSLVGPIRQTGIIVTTLLAFWFMKGERTDFTRKLVAAGICTVGVVLLVI